MKGSPQRRNVFLISTALASRLARDRALRDAGRRGKGGGSLSGPSKKQSAVEALKIGFETQKSLSGHISQADRNNLIARNILHEDLGYFSDALTSYSLDEETRDRLIAHSRQDAAHALTNTITLMESQGSQSWTNRLLLIVIVLLGYIAYRVST